MSAVSNVELSQGTATRYEWADRRGAPANLIAQWTNSINELYFYLYGANIESFSAELLEFEGLTNANVQALAQPTLGYVEVFVTYTQISSAPASPIVAKYNGKTIFAATLYANNVISVSDGVNVDLPTSQIQTGYRRCVVNGNATSNDRELQIKCYETFDLSNLELWGNTQITGATFEWQGTTLIVRYTMTNQTAQSLDSLYITKGEDTFLSVYPYASTLTTNSYGIWNYSTMPPVKVYP